MNEAQPREAAQGRLEIGTRLLIKNQQFELIGHRLHTRCDGTATVLVRRRERVLINGLWFYSQPNPLAAFHRK